MTLVEMLERNASEVPQKTAIIFHTSKLSYRELNEMVNRVANTLLEMGVKPGDRVGFMLPRIPELIISFLAVAKTQGIVVPINFELPKQRIRSILNTILPQCVIAHATFLEHLKGAIPEAAPTRIIAVGKGNGEGKCLWWNELKNKKAANPGLEIKDENIVYLNYTSGSTGNSKGAITSHANIYHNTIAAVDALGLTPDDVHLCMFAPFAHPHEIFARPLYLGGTLVLVDTVYPKSLAEAISTHQVTCMMGLAPMYENLLGMLEHKSYDLGCLRVPESGGMYTRTELIEMFRRKVGVPIIPVWGSTETTGIALANRPGEYIPPGSVGKPCPSYEIKIVNERDTEVLPGEVGEMIFKGPAVVQGYYENAANSQACFKNGWYHSGDLGKRDKEGNFYFVERATGMMKVAGLKVYPLEIELVLMSHPDIREAAVISARDRLRGEVPKAIIVTRNGNGLTEKEIMVFCRERLAHYKLPRIVEIRESLPKIGSGKIDKKALQMECV
jgi:acyl-coenzyme A synthetase/AMP-(fatty) acid ligase